MASGLGLVDEWYATRQPPFSSRGAGPDGMQQQQQRASAQGMADELQPTQRSQRQQQASAPGLADQWHVTQQPRHGSRSGTEGTFGSDVPVQHSVGQAAEEGPAQSAATGGVAAGMKPEHLQQCDGNKILRHPQQALAEQRRERLRQMADIEQRLQACLQRDSSGRASSAEVRGVEVQIAGGLAAELCGGYATTWMWPDPLLMGAADGYKSGNLVPLHREAVKSCYISIVHDVSWLEV